MHCYLIYYLDLVTALSSITLNFETKPFKLHGKDNFPLNMPLIQIILILKLPFGAFYKIALLDGSGYNLILHFLRHGVSIIYNLYK